MNPHLWDSLIQNDCTEDFAVEIEGEPGILIQFLEKFFQTFLVIEKHTFDGFKDTFLDQVLKENGIKNVIICGLVTAVSLEF